MLLIPLYLTESFHCPPSLILSSPLTIDFLTSLLLLNLNMTTPFAQYVDGMMGDHPILNQPLQLVGFYLKTYLASLTDRTLFRTLLATLLNMTSPSLVGGLMKPIKMWTIYNTESWTWRES